MDQRLDEDDANPHGLDRPRDAGTAGRELRRPEPTVRNIRCPPLFVARASDPRGRTDFETRADSPERYGGVGDGVRGADGTATRPGGGTLPTGAFGRSAR